MRVLEVPSEPDFELLGFRTVERVPEDRLLVFLRRPYDAEVVIDRQTDSLLVIRSHKPL